MCKGITLFFSWRTFSLTRTTVSCVINCLQALEQLQLNQKKVTALGVSNEELLLEETASREQVLLSTISDIETELRNTRHILERVTNEKVHSS